MENKEEWDCGLPCGTPPPLSAFVYKGRTLLSPKNPKISCERLIASLPILERTLYLCVSPLFGYGLDNLLARIHPSSAVLAVEAEAPLASLAETSIPLEVRSHPRFMLVHADGGGLSPITQARSWFGEKRAFRRVVRFNLCAGAQLHAALYDGIEKSIAQEIQRDWENAATLVQLGRTYALNFLRNLHLLGTLPSVAAFHFDNETYDEVAVLGAGSSLDRFFDGSGDSHCAASGGAARSGVGDSHQEVPVTLVTVTKRCQSPSTGRRAIVCVDTALPCLRDRGVKADLVVALEAQHWNLRDFIGCGGAASALAMDMSAMPATARLIDGKTYLFWTPWTPLRFFDKLRAANLLPLEMPPLGNVGITAFCLVRRLTSKKTTAHGLDFSFTVDSYHCRGSPGHIDKLRRQTRFSGVLSADAAFRPSTFACINENGENVRRDPVMRSYQKLFDSVCDALAPLSPVLPVPPEAKRAALAQFLGETRDSFLRIRAILTGEERADKAALATLLSTNDFLYAHYPDYAATDRPPDVNDISFLNRLRAEIDMFIGAL